MTWRKIYIRMKLTVSEERYMSLSYIDEGKWLLFNDVDPESRLQRVNNCYISKKIFLKDNTFFEI